MPQQKINLDQIAEKVKEIPKRPSLESIIPSLIHAFDKNFVIEGDDGHFKEFKNVDDETKNKLSDVITEELFYILATKYFNIKKEDFEKLKEFNKYKDEFGNHLNDAPLKLYMGIGRKEILRAIKGLTKLDYGIILDIGKNVAQTHSTIIATNLLEPIKPEDVPALKEWIMKNGDDNTKREVKEIYDPEQLKMYFINTAMRNYQA